MTRGIAPLIGGKRQADA